MSAKALFIGSTTAVLSLFASTFTSTAAHAQTAPPATAGGTASSDNASSGTTDVVKDSFATSAARDANKDGTAATVQAGGLFSTGNARSLAITASGTYRYRADNHQFSAAAAANYGRAAADKDSPIATTVENVQGLLRYDYFFAEHWSGFLQAALRRDKFQGLDLRLNIDPGVSYSIIDDKQHRLWFEVGYDFQHDIRRGANVREAQEAYLADPTTAPEEPTHRTADRHSARLFFGYDNQLNAYLTFTTGLEYLQAFDPTRSWRMTWNSSLKSALSDKFSVATTFTLRYDHDPLPDIKDTDAITSVALIYNFR